MSAALAFLLALLAGYLFIGWVHWCDTRHPVCNCERACSSDS